MSIFKKIVDGLGVAVAKKYEKNLNVNGFIGFFSNSDFSASDDIKLDGFDTFVAWKDTLELPDGSVFVCYQGNYWIYQVNSLGFIAVKNARMSDSPLMRFKFELFLSKYGLLDRGDVIALRKHYGFQGNNKKFVRSIKAS